MPPKILLLRGLPGSGKSTYAKELMEKNPGKYKRVNRDLLREMLDNGKYSKDREMYIRDSEFTLAEMFLLSNFHVIVDDCNLASQTVERWQDFAISLSLPIEFKDFTDVSLETCLARDRKRANYVGERVIIQMYYQHIYKPPQPSQRDSEGLLPAVLCDMDGTLAFIGDRSPYDTAKCGQDQPNWTIVKIVLHYQQAGYKVVITSGRSREFEKETRDWLKFYEISPDLLLMRNPGDTRKDVIVKCEMYEKYIASKYQILFALDDRSQVISLWRSLGLTALQVAEGDF